MIGCAEDIMLAAFAAGLRPDPILSVSEWAEQHRMLSSKGSAEPGPWRNERTPYLREIMDCLSDNSPIETVTFMKGSQIGGSEAGFNWIGYVMHHSPGPMMMVQPTIELAKRTVRQRVDPMVRECPALAELVHEQRSRDTANTMLQKEFPGGLLISSGANSAPSLRSAPIGKLMLDEIDAYPDDLDGEGSPVDLAKVRTRNFARRKILEVSSPTIKGTSKISKSFEESDKRFYFVPCPHCHTKQVIKWENIHWEKTNDGKPILKSVHMVCDAAACGKKIPEFHKTWMLSEDNGAEWIATNANEFNKRHAGFHLSALYSPLGWYSWADAVAQFYKGKDDPRELQVFINTGLGECFEVKAEDAVEWKDVYHKREDYPLAIVPIQACLLTGSVDVQKDRFEVLVEAWNRKESWIVERLILPCDTSQPESYTKNLDPLLERHWPHAAGTSLPLTMIGIDSGYESHLVYEYVRTRDPSRVRALDGRENLKAAVGAPKAVDIRLNGKRLARAARIWPVGTSHLKHRVFARMKLKRPTDEDIAKSGYPSTYIHFSKGFDEEFFRQACAEQFLLQRKIKGEPIYAWQKIYQRNEVLDLLVYSQAVYHLCGAHRLTDDEWNRLAAGVAAVHLHAKPVTIAPPKPPATQQKPPAPPARPKRPSYWDR